MPANLFSAIGLTLILFASNVIGPAIFQGLTREEEHFLKLLSITVQRRFVDFKTIFND